MRANVLSGLRWTPPAFGHPLMEGEVCRTRGMGLIGQIGLIIMNYESDEEWGLGFDGGCDAAGGMPTGEGRTDEECAC